MSNSNVCDFEMKTLSSLGIRLLDCEHRTPKPSPDSFSFAYIAIPNIQNGHIDLTNVRYISEKDFIDWTRKNKAQQGDILLTRRARVGDTAVIPEGLRCAIGQNIVMLRSDEKQIKQKFLRWALRGLLYQQQVQKYLNVGAIFDSLNVRDIPKFMIPVPPISEQVSIADILDSLDLKIQLNIRMNKTLEVLTKDLFTHWFIDFEFPNEEGKPYKSSGGDMIYNEELGKIPKEWKVTQIGNIAKFQKGMSYTGKEKFSQQVDGSNVFITLNNILEGGGFKTQYSWIKSTRIKEHHTVEEYDLILANTEQTKTGRLLGFPALIIFPFNYNQAGGVFSHHVTKIIPSSSNLKYYLYLFLKSTQKYTIAYHTGTTVWGFDVHNFENNRHILYPSEELMTKFHNILEPIIKKISLNCKQISVLHQTRDMLIPKLMSGKIRVPARGG